MIVIKKQTSHLEKVSAFVRWPGVLGAAVKDR